MARTGRNSQLLLLAALTGCGWHDEEAAIAAQQRPPAAAIVAMAEATPLDDLLAALERDLDEVIEGGMLPEVEPLLFRAEAMTDRLPEARMPFRWLGSEQYSLDARLRQIQSQADRSVAALISGMPRDSVLLEARILRQEVASLRQAIAAGGGPSRVPVSQLIEALDTLRAPQPPPEVAPPEPAPEPATPPPGQGTT
jgi:hypothetical protein